MGNVPANGLTTPHAAGVAPSVPKGTPDPCRHRRKKKKQVFVVYMAQQTGSNPTKYYVGRTRGPDLDSAIATRQAGHHRTDIGKLVPVCQADSYSACRGAEQKHYAHMEAQGKVITTKRRKGAGKQIAPISKDNPKKKDYETCATKSARPSPPGCPICAA